MRYIIMYQVVGFDAVGIVEELGIEAKKFEKGDRVYYAGDVSRSGTNSELQAVDENIVAKAPHKLSNADAAGIPLVSLTVIEALTENMRIPFNPQENDGKTILITAGAGGVGSFAVQFAKKVI